MARMAKVDYKSEKIPVSLTLAEKLEIEKDARDLGISAPGLLRLLYKNFKKNREDAIKFIKGEAP